VGGKLADFVYFSFDTRYVKEEEKKRKEKKNRVVE
jgi:hypothetical protein